jgi:D-alanine-D-alanine ligase
MSEPLSITVLLGGPSAEREVSLRSGRAIASALRSLGHFVSELDPVQPDWKLEPGTDLVFLALHGTYGEDGTVQRQLEQLGVPFTGCDSESSRIAFDKVLTKERCLDAGVPTPRFLVFRENQGHWPAGWEPPVVLKPVRQGSSVGLKFVNRPGEFQAALEEVFQFDSEVLMEERIVGKETTVGILGDAALPVVEVRPKVGEYDYQNKYTAGATEYLCPAPLGEELAERLQSVALAAFRAVGGRDYGRVDVLVGPDSEPRVLEVNTLPGMTETSLFPMAAAAGGLGFEAVCQRMVDLALVRRGAVPEMSGDKSVPAQGLVD